MCIKTNWYRKPSNTLEFNHWDSHGPKIYKINLIRTMINRLRIICSDENLFRNDLSKLKDSFLWSGYPNFIIEKYFNLYSHSKFQYSENFNVPKEPFYFGFEYINDSSELFVKNITKLISKYFGYIKCIPYFKKGRNLLSYFSSKIKDYEMDKATGVYRIPCECCRASLNELMVSYLVKTAQSYICINDLLVI